MSEKTAKKLVVFVPNYTIFRAYFCEERATDKFPLVGFFWDFFLILQTC